MAQKTVSFNADCDLIESHLETLTKWLSCNGEVWGVGPTTVFASAAALFLYNELEATVFIVGDHVHVSLLEKSLISTMVLGMLALMIHVWVCSMRFFQYYLDTLIRDSPNMLLEMTTAGLLGGQAELVALGPLTRFLRQQQPQIHITICWFLSLCYADYVRKHYCQRFNMPYLEQWQAELHARVAHGAQRAVDQVNSFVGSVHQRLRGLARQQRSPSTFEGHTGSASSKHSSVPVSGTPSVGGSVGDPDNASCCSRELHVRVVGKSSETTVNAIEKLRTYITATRCTCCDIKESCMVGPVAPPDKKTQS